MKKVSIILFVFIFPVILFAQTGTIKGIVTDTDGIPLAGANVIIVGTDMGGATDINGQFKISIPVGSYTVRVEYIGYKTEILKDINVLSDQFTTHDIMLTQEVLTGEEIVVIGYGVQKKKDLTGATSRVDVEDTQKLAITEVSTALQGRIAGADISQTSGAPGSGASIRIRGIGTLSGFSPLVIVDGVPSSMDVLDAVNPEDIESINVLKDASSAAIYGSRAGNGVIIITTKRGKEGPVQIKFSSKTSMHNVAKNFPLVTNSDDYISIVKNAADNAGESYPDFVDMYEDNPSQFSSGTDWQDAYFRSALMQDYDLTISGGTKNLNFAISGNYSDQEGIIVTTYNKRMGLRINSDFTKGRLKIGESLSLSRFIGKARYEEGGIYTLNQYNFFDLCGLSPLVPVYDESNSTGYAGQDPTIGFYREIDNIVGNMNIRDNKYDDIVMMASAYAEYSPMEGLTYKARLSQNFWNNYLYYFNPEFFLSNLDLNDKTNMSERRSQSYHTIMDHTLTYQTQLNKHSIEAMVGYSQEKTNYRSTYGSVAEFPDDDLRVLDAGTESDNAAGYEVEWHYRSYFGRLNYNYDDKYLLQLNYRRDGSSRFSKENRWGDFPSMSLGWRISEEPFFNLPFIKDLKIRGSYGVLGMQEFDDYMYYALISSDSNENLNYPFGPGKEQAVYIGSRATYFPSIGLKWEESKQTDIGFDAALLDNKLTFGFDYYIKQNEDILFNPTIPISTGSSENPYVNTASVENKGVEITVRYRNIDNPFKYEINLTATTNSNEVTSLGDIPSEAVDAGDVYWAFDTKCHTVAGKPLAPFYLYETDGIFKSQEEVDKYLESVNTYINDVTPQPGDVKYVDRNGDGIINADDKKFFGNAMPSAQFGLNLNLSYKRFDFNMFLYGVVGRQMYNGAKMLAYWTNHAPGNYHKDLLDAWSEENSNSNIPRVIQGDDRNVQDSDRFLEDADYLRLKHIEVGYTLPSSLIFGYGVKSLRVYIAAENLFTITQYSGYDPAIDFDNRFARGVDRSPYPIPRQFLTGIQIGL